MHQGVVPLCEDLGMDVVMRNMKCYSNLVKNKEYSGFRHGCCTKKYEVLFKFGED